MEQNTSRIRTTRTLGVTLAWMSLSQRIRKQRSWRRRIARFPHQSERLKSGMSSVSSPRACTGMRCHRSIQRARKLSRSAGRSTPCAHICSRNVPLSRDLSNDNKAAMCCWLRSTKPKMRRHRHIHPNKPHLRALTACHPLPTPLRRSPRVHSMILVIPITSRSFPRARITILGIPITLGSFRRARITILVIQPHPLLPRYHPCFPFKTYRRSLQKTIHQQAHSVLPLLRSLKIHLNVVERRSLPIFPRGPVSSRQSSVRTSASCSWCQVGHGMS